MRIRHSDEHNPAGCTICNKVFKNKYSLRAHINIYHKEMNTGPGPGLSSSASYSPYSSSSEYNTSHQQHQQQSNNLNLHSDYTNSHQQSQSSLSLSYSSINTNNYSAVPSSISNDMSSYELMKESVMNSFNVSNLPLT